eukprot:TRINITY_DN20467_c0_g1_i1.p1 TRINITY_DN20467_c0_g1~~TRINITY_DN20467_c0_g1_i1.p1  ORF type:complete len:351 (+),score=67.12 TRINITY_DN20467_c0_g1_i1:72-1124(+)
MRLLVLLQAAAACAVGLGSAAWLAGAAAAARSAASPPPPPAPTSAPQSPIVPAPPPQPPPANGPPSAAAEQGPPPAGSAGGQRGAGFAACRSHGDAGCAWAAQHPEGVGRLVAEGAARPDALELLMVPIHRTLDRLMVDACEGKKRGCIDGFVLPEQAEAYFHWARDEWTEGGTICETGFNAGHSAVAFLLGRPGSRVVSFDYMAQAYSRATLAWLQRVFTPDRVRVMPGDTAKTLPRAAAASGAGAVRCDALSVDGAHNARACRRDVLGLSRLAVRSPVPVLMDDTAQGFEKRNEGPAGVWRRLVGERRIRQRHCQEYGPRTQWRRGSRAKPRGYCVGALNRDLEPFAE